MSAREIAFTVTGVPQPKGSTRAFVMKRRDGPPRAIVTSDNPKNKGWQQMIANCAALELRRGIYAEARLIFQLAPVVLDVAFFLPRPKTLLTKKNAPLAFFHLKKPDLDKLVRSCKDALTGVVWTDDSQVVEVHARKTYCASGAFPRVEIQIREAIAEGETHAATA